MISLSRYTGIVLGFGLTIGTVCFFAETGDNIDLSDEFIEHGDSHLGSTRNAQRSGGGRILLHLDTTLQRAQFAAIEHELGDNGILLQNREFGVESDEWLFSTSFFVDSISPVNGFNRLYVMGTLKDEMTTVIERWDFRPPEQQFLKQPTVRRTRVYTGLDWVGPVEAEIRVDPEERFVIVSHGAQGRFLDQLYLETGVIVPITNVLIDSNHRVGFHWPVQHAVDGRAWMVSLESTQDLLLLSDANNDTVFEFVVQIDQPTRVAMGYEYDGANPAIYGVVDFFNGQP